MNKPLGSILDDLEHQRLLADLEGVCQTANIPQSFVHRSMAACGASPTDIEWVTGYPLEKARGRGGLVITGSDSETRCMAIAGAFLRNFIDARVVTLNTLIDSASKAANTIDPTVLIVPNWYVTTHGTAKTSWQVQSLYDILVHRLVNNRLTVLYVQSMAGLKEAYGVLMHEHLQSNFVITK